MEILIKDLNKEGQSLTNIHSKTVILARLWFWYIKYNAHHSSFVMEWQTRQLLFNVAVLISNSSVLKEYTIEAFKDDFEAEVWCDMDRELVQSIYNALLEPVEGMKICYNIGDNVSADIGFTITTYDPKNAYQFNGKCNTTLCLTLLAMTQFFNASTAVNMFISYSNAEIELVLSIKQLLLELDNSKPSQAVLDIAEFDKLTLLVKEECNGLTAMSKTSEFVKALRFFKDKGLLGVLFNTLTDKPNKTRMLDATSINYVKQLYTEDKTQKESKMETQDFPSMLTEEKLYTYCNISFVANHPCAETLKLLLNQDISPNQCQDLQALSAFNIIVRAVSSKEIRPTAFGATIHSLIMTSLLNTPIFRLSDLMLILENTLDIPQPIPPQHQLHELAKIVNNIKNNDSGWHNNYANGYRGPFNRR